MVSIWLYIFINAGDAIHIDCSIWRWILQWPVWGCREQCGESVMYFCMLMAISSVQFSHSVVSDSLWPHEPQHARPPSPSPTPGVYPYSCPLSQWCPSKHLILCHPRLFLPSIFPSIRVFPNKSALHMRWPKYWSFRFSISPSNEHPGLISFRMDWLDLLADQGLSRVFSNTTVQKYQFCGTQLSSQSNSHIHTWPLEKL